MEINREVAEKNVTELSDSRYRDRSLNYTAIVEILSAGSLALLFLSLVAIYLIS